MPDILLPPQPSQLMTAKPQQPKVLAFLNTRRSTPLPLLAGPGPKQSQLDLILRLASRVPDHRRVVPWRFVIFEGSAKDQAAAQIMARFRQLNTNASQQDIEAEGRKFRCCPLVIALVFSPEMDHKTPVWEQQLSVGAVGQNLLLAADASGFGASWLTYWYASDPVICKCFGLGDPEQIAGFFHLGTITDPPQERPRPNMDKIVSYWLPTQIQ